MVRRGFTGDAREDEDLFSEESIKKDTSDEFAALLRGSKSEGFVKLSVGEKIDAIVVSKGTESIFVDIGRRSEGVVAREEFSSEELESLKTGDKISLYVVKISGSEIVLSKSLSGREMGHLALQESYKTGLPIQGKVVKENKGGFEIDVAGGKGFVPFSQIDIGLKQPSSAYIGQTFQFKIVRIEGGGRDVVLSRASLLREEAERVREAVLSELVPEQTREGKIVTIEKFGVFVDLGGGLTGLVPISECSWSKRQDPKELYQLGQSVNVKILKVEQGQGKPRILLSLKQIGETPWETMADKIKIGDVVTGYATRLMTFGAFLEILPGLEGLLHISEMSAKKRVHAPGQVVKVGDSVKVKVTSIDSMNQRISLSIKAIEEEELGLTQLAEKAEEEKKKNSEDEVKITGVEFISKGSLGTLGDAFAKAAQAKKK